MEEKNNLNLEENEILRIIVTKNPNSEEIDFLIDALHGDEDAKEIEEVFLDAMKKKYENFETAE